MRLRTSGLTWSVVGDDVVVLDLDGSVYMKLNESGSLLWEQLAQPHTVHELAEVLVQRYEVSEPQALADVDEFIAELRRRNLVDDS